MVDVVFGATGGYVVGFIPAAILIGLGARHAMDRNPLKAVPLFIAGQAVVFAVGVPWLAVAGAGDVLAGVIGALLAAGLDPFDAAATGSWVHGAAATLAGAGGPVAAGDVAASVPEVVRALLR